MMRILMTATASLALLAACGDGTNPFDAEETTTGGGDAPVIDEGSEVTTEGIPVSLADDLRSVVYDPSGGGSLSVDLAALDRTDSDIPLAAYSRNTNLETPAMIAQGYQVYSYQDDPLDRMFVAIVSQTADGSVMGAVVMDGGQFTKFFSGGFYATDGSYTPGTGPNDTGLVSYAGLYSGLSNLNADGAELAAVPVGTDPAILPAQPAQIEGQIFLNVDFGDNTINGAIYDRAFVNLDPALELLLTNGSDLDNVFLIPATITDTGTFFGEAENPAQETIGGYGGTFGGTEASGASGVVQLDGNWLADIDNEVEFGVFVLTQCGQPGEDPLCASIPVSP